MNRVAVVGISDMKAARRRDDATFFQLAYDAAKEAVEDARLAYKVSGLQPGKRYLCGSRFCFRRERGGRP